MVNAKYYFEMGVVLGRFQYFTKKRVLDFAETTSEIRLPSSILSRILIFSYTSLLLDSLRVGRSGDRIPVGAIFSAPVQTGPRAHPASNTMNTGSFPGLKRPGRGVDHPPHLAPRLKKE
jgi:hypothetical protein